jgi:hypothetical protein
VAAGFVASINKIDITHNAKVLESYSFGIALHFLKDVFDPWHDIMIPLLILLSILEIDETKK